MNDSDNFHPVRLRRIVMTWTLHVERFTTAVYGFEMPESRLVWLLHSLGPRTASQLVEPALMRKFQISRSIARLRELGVVSTVQHPDDLRSEIIELTAQGRACAKQLTALSVKWANAMEQGLSEREHTLLNTLLTKLDAGVNALAPLVDADLAAAQRSNGRALKAKAQPAARPAAKTAKTAEPAPRKARKQAPHRLHIR